MKARRTIILFFILLILTTGVILPTPINNLDELWNFNFARNIANGKLPYKDFNMVQTPLSSMIAGTTLKLCGTELIVMRVLAIILATLIMFSIYMILKKCNIVDSFIYMFLIITFMLLKTLFCYDYNFIVALIILITIYIEIKNIDKLNYQKDFILGLLVGTSILTKQTTGLALSLVFIFYKILIIYDKTEWKQELKRSLVRMLGVSIPVIIFSIYLTINNIWNEFIDYTILGIKTFSNTISYLNLVIGRYGFAIQILSIIAPIFLIYMYIKTIVIKNQKKEDKVLFTFFAYSVASVIVIYPISDSIHFLIGILPIRDSYVLYDI